MKHIEIEDHTELREFLAISDRNWTGVVLQALDLSELDETLAAEDITKSTAIGTPSVIFAQGNAGTVQEIFQDACQNYYSTYGPPTPMVLLDSAYWNRRSHGTVEPKHKPVWPLLQQLANERSKEGFPRAILLTDSIDEAIAHIVRLDSSN